MPEITELPRPAPQQLGGIPSAAVFPPVPANSTAGTVIYDQPNYDYGHVEPAIAYSGPQPWDVYGYPAGTYSDQPVGYVQSPGSDRAVSTSERTDAWRQRR